MEHLKQLVKSEENSAEIEGLLTSYNEMVQQISNQLEYLDMITAKDPVEKKAGASEEQGAN